MPVLLDLFVIMTVISVMYLPTVNSTITGQPILWQAAATFAYLIPARIARFLGATAQCALTGRLSPGALVLVHFFGTMCGILSAVLVHKILAWRIRKKERELFGPDDGGPPILTNDSVPWE